MIVSEIVGQIIMDLVFYIFLYVIFLSVVSKNPNCFHLKWVQKYFTKLYCLMLLRGTVGLFDFQIFSKSVECQLLVVAMWIDEHNMKGQKCQTKGGAVIVVEYLIAQNRSQGNLESINFFFWIIPHGKYLSKNMWIWLCCF